MIAILGKIEQHSETVDNASQRNAAHNIGWYLRAKAFKLTGVQICSGQCCVLHLCFLVLCTCSSSLQREASQALHGRLKGLKYMPSSVYGFESA